MVIVAKRLDRPYRPGERAMRKYKLWQTVDCVVGGIHYKRGTETVESLLMGLYDDAGKLNLYGPMWDRRAGRGDRQAAEASNRRVRLYRQCSKWSQPLVRSRA
jgi:hypothetical protein